jgi:hypothetical protein
VKEIHKENWGKCCSRIISGSHFFPADLAFPPFGSFSIKSNILLYRDMQLLVYFIEKVLPAPQMLILLKVGAVLNGPFT